MIPIDCVVDLWIQTRTENYLLHWNYEQRKTSESFSLQANLESIETFRQLNETADVADTANATNKSVHKRAATDATESFYK